MSGSYDPHAVADTERKTWDRFGSKYLHTFAAITSRGAALLMEAADLRPGDAVLEIGCGPGNVAARLAETGARVVGIDFAPHMVQAARAAYREIDFQEADAEDLPFEPGTFQAVAACYTLHHLARPERVLSEIHRVLAPGGRLVFVHPQEQESMNIFFEAVAAHHTPEAVPHGPLFGCTDQSLFESMVSTAGFSDCRLEIRELPLQLRSIQPLLEGCREFIQMDALPEALQQKIEAATLQNAKAHQRGSVFTFADTVLLGRAVKPLEAGRPTSGCS
jgi:ubiquinone/menaquinone biosynthesis C-methylase UbiE